MTGMSFSMGRIFGVEVRLHLFFVILLLLSMSWAAYLQVPMVRGVALWGLLLMAVVVREIARGIAAAWYAIDAKSILLLPTGGILVYASPEAMARAGEAKVQKRMALVGPAANIVFGMTMAGIVLTVAPGVDLWGVKWVSPEHLLRTLVWVNLLLAAVNFLPAWSLDAGRVMRGEIVRTPGGGANALRGMQMFQRMSPAIVAGLVVFGIVTLNWWMIMAGLAVYVGAQVERQGLLAPTDGELVRVSEVMLTEYSILPASATLEDAVEQARHTLQDVFPVVRGGRMVGAVAKQSILEALEASGNGYIQGIMTKAFETASPGDSLMATLNRVTAAAGASSQLVPVVEGERVVGIITPQNLQRSMALLVRKQVEGGRDGAGRRDSTDRDDESH